MYPIRFTGINSTELHRYSSTPSKRRGECHAREAAAEMDRLIKGSHRRVRLVAQHASSRSGHRLRRSVQVRMHGHWVDTGPIQLAKGNALWLPNGVERAWGRQYGRVAQEAAARGVGLYNTSYCGSGPDQAAKLQLRVNWDAAGDDATDVNGEWVDVTNLDETRSVNLSHWKLRDSALRHFTIPGGTVVPPGERFRLHVGRGHNKRLEAHWGFRKPAFDAGGDGAYLFDPQGDLRAWMIYPCRVACTDPLHGRVRLTASYHGLPEYALIRNISSAPLNLNTYVLGLPFHNYQFGPNSLLQPGEAMRVDAQGNPSNNTRLHRYYGFRGYMMSDGGQRVTLDSYRDVRVACYAWGRFNCR
jgi:hypothetical protein